MNLYRSLFILAVALGCSCSATAQAASCKGKFPNPITDICWSCVLPIKIGSTQIMSMDQEDNDSSPSGVLCVCAEEGIPRVGINMSFFEPARIAESVRQPYCFPSLGGMKIDFGIHAPEHGTMNKGEAAQMQTAFYQEHWYLNPLMFWLEVLLDNFCLERGSFDLAYLFRPDTSHTPVRRHGRHILN
jgi:conjugal transfer pilus assembly protein TraU